MVVEKGMGESTSKADTIARLYAEAEFYEAQGLHSHAVAVYRKILVADPGDPKALQKLKEIGSPESEQTEPELPPPSHEELYPRAALDLGLAYMGMNLYNEALEEFRKVLLKSPAVRAPVWEHIVTCLIRLEKYSEAEMLINRVLGDRTLTVAEKGGIIGEAAGTYLAQGLMDKAHDLLSQLPKEQCVFVPDFDKMMAQLSEFKSVDSGLEVLVEDIDTGQMYRVEQEMPIHIPDSSRTPENAAAGMITETKADARETELMQAAPETTHVIGIEPDAAEITSVAVAPDDALDLPEKRVDDTFLFACQCGGIHSALKKSAGLKVICAGCGRELVVPQVDEKLDGLSEKVVGRVVGGCRILYRIGGGGMGGVFKAHHLGLDVSVAVKILHFHLAEKDPVFIKRFIREARATAKLEHPNVVGVMNVGFEYGIHYLIMPYVSGGSAASRLNETGRLPLEDVLDIAIQIAGALKTAQDHNITHRDIKPANILFTEKGEVKLADLGLAKSYMDSADSGLTQTGIACGTPLYFSPEQAKGASDLDIRSDIYSLGITLYHLLEGSPPFTGESAYVIFQKHVSEELPPFKKATPPVPESFFKVLQKMTAKDRKERYSSADELLEALRTLKEDLRKKAKPARRRKGLLEWLGLRRAS